MEVPHQLQTLLQFLGTDASSVTHLSYILDHLSPSSLAPSPHLQKWITRVTSLMHSKDPAARWAAICIAYRTSFLSRSLLIDNAQSWVGIALPSLSKPEPAPILRASMRYLSLVLSAAQHNLEFQRQVAIPILPKVSSALLTIAEKHSDQDIRASSIQMLAQLVPLYPSAHKALSQRFFSLCNQNFDGSACRATGNLLDATTDLYAILHSLGGKVGGTHLWRHCLDEALQFSWSAWLALRTTFPTSALLSHKAMGYLRSSDGKPPNSILHADTTTENPLEAATLNLNRLKCGVSAIGALLRAPVSRPVKLPTGHLATFCSCLLTSTLDDEGQVHFDPFVKAVESAVVPQIWIEACRLLSCLAEATQGLLTPHSSRLIIILSTHLENNFAQSQKHSFLQCAYDLLHFCPAIGTTIGINRLLKAAISTLSPLYFKPTHTETNSGPARQSRATKKRRQDYEADNMLSATNITVCETSEGCDTLITALDVVAQCMMSAELDPSTRSLANRVLLSILLSLPSIAPSNLSSDPSFQGRVIKKVRDICFESVRGTSYAMSKSTTLFLRACLSENLTARDKYYSQVDLLLHPRRPPFVRTLPFVESLSLASAEESAEETATRQSLGLEFGNGQMHSIPSERQNHPDPVGKTSSVLDPPPAINLLREGPWPSSIELQPQTIRNGNGSVPMEAATPTVLPTVPSPQATSNVPSETSLSISDKVPTPTVCAVPMLVDESDHEEVPIIDLGSDSDD